jgi:hypothetical protein
VKTIERKEEEEEKEDECDKTGETAKVSSYNQVEKGICNRL